MCWSERGSQPLRGGEASLSSNAVCRKPAASHGVVDTKGALNASSARQTAAECAVADTGACVTSIPNYLAKRGRKAQGLRIVWRVRLSALDACEGLAGAGTPGRWVMEDQRCHDFPASP